MTQKFRRIIVRKLHGVLCRTMNVEQMHVAQTADCRAQPFGFKRCLLQLTRQRQQSCESNDTEATCISSVNRSTLLSETSTTTSTGWLKLAIFSIILLAIFLAVLVLTAVLSFFAGRNDWLLSRSAAYDRKMTQNVACQPASTIKQPPRANATKNVELPALLVDAQNESQATNGTDTPTTTSKNEFSDNLTIISCVLIIALIVVATFIDCWCKSRNSSDKQQRSRLSAMLRAARQLQKPGSSVTISSCNSGLLTARLTATISCR